MTGIRVCALMRATEFRDEVERCLLELGPEPLRLGMKATLQSGWELLKHVTVPSSRSAMLASTRCLSRPSDEPGAGEGGLGEERGVYSHVLLQRMVSWN